MPATSTTLRVLTQALGPMKYWLRWILVVPSIMFVWFIAIELGYGAIYLLNSFCAPDDYGPWLCAEQWYVSVAPWVVYVWAMLSVMSVILTAVLVAPSHKTIITWLAVCVGVSVGCAMADDGQVELQIVCVIIGGLLGLATSFRWLVPRHSHGPHANARSNGA